MQMKNRLHSAWLPALIVLISAGSIAIAGCSKDSPTTPVVGGSTPELSSGNIPNGGVFQHTFATAGTFPYHCSLHGAMTGNSVVVSAGSVNDSAFVQIVSLTAPGFSPPSVTIKPGGHVRWLNVQGSPHTVTSGN
jgi:plastocyanin